MVTLSTWWLGLTMACFIISTTALIGLLGGLIYLVAKAQKLVVDFSAKGLPQVYHLTEQVNTIALRVDNIARKIDEESHVALPKVEHMLDKVDHTMEILEGRTERVNEMLDTTQEGIQKVRESPVTRRVLVGAGTLAAARLIKNTVEHYKGRSNRLANGNGNMHHT